MVAGAGSLLAKAGIKLFHGAVKDFNSFKSKHATETAFGKGLSFTPEKKVAEEYATLTPSKIRKLWGSEHVEEAIQRKKGGTPILYEVEARIEPEEILLARKNLEGQDPKVRKKILKLIDELGLNPETLDLDKPKFWRSLLKATGEDADKLFPEFQIKAILKDGSDSTLKQVGGKLEYTIFDEKVLSITNKKYLKDKKKKVRRL